MSIERSISQGIHPATPSLTDSGAQQLAPDQLHADAATWVEQINGSRTTASVADALIGQQRALRALSRAQRLNDQYSHVFAVVPPGLHTQQVFAAVAQQQAWSGRDLHDWVYLVNPTDATQPICLSLPAGSANAIIQRIESLLAIPVAERAPLVSSLEEEFNWPELNRYLKLIENKNRNDLHDERLGKVIVTHESQRGWFYCSLVNEAELFGQLYLQTVAGTVSGGLHLIQPGALLKANGGTLVVDAEQLLHNSDHWHRLKHILKHGEFVWSAPQSASAFYQPQSVPIRLKVILAGSRALLAHLRELDVDFSNLFPYLADFTDHYSTVSHSVQDYVNYLAYLQQRCGHRELSDTGLQALLSLSSSLTEHQQELSLDTLRLHQLLQEAETIAQQHDQPHISAQHIYAASDSFHEREHYLAELSRQGILEQQVKIDTQGDVVGQINGLTVVTMGGSEFGEPSRITATVHYGDGDIIDIERKSELSGNIHTKGVMILMAYLANLFAGKDPMPLSATLVFEQSYHEVDGDSASMAELCCLVSALSDTPINQALAVTGAIDQFGNVQAIGGVNEKIEGFYRLCKHRGFAPGQGVVIPHSNQVNLHLSPELVQAVTEGKFSVYTVNHVTQAFELLMRTPWGTVGDFNADTLFGRVQQRIKQAQHHDEQQPWWKFW